MTRVPFSITIAGLDSNGLLSRIGRLLQELGCELADTRIARLVGLCTGMFVVYAPSGTTVGMLEQSFQVLTDEGMTITVREAPDDGWPSHRSPLTNPFIISYEGADKPGVLVSLAHTLSESGCSFADVAIDSTVGNRSNAFVLVCEVEAPFDKERLSELTTQVGREHGVELSVLPANLDDLDFG